MNKYSMFCVAVFEFLARNSGNDPYGDVFEFNYDVSELRIKYLNVIIKITHFSNVDSLSYEIFSGAFVYDSAEAVKDEIIKLIEAYNQKQ